MTGLFASPLAASLWSGESEPTSDNRLWWKSSIALNIDEEYSAIGRSNGNVPYEKSATRSMQPIGQLRNVGLAGAWLDLRTRRRRSRSNSANPVD
jgi:hypothetical protein